MTLVAGTRSSHTLHLQSTPRQTPSLPLLHMQTMATMASEDLNLGASALSLAPAAMDEAREVTSSEVAALLESSRPAIEVDGFVDGRTTPTPESESANFLPRNPSFQSQSAPTAEVDGLSAPVPVQPTDRQAQPQSQSTNPILAHKAEVGFGSLSGEDQLKASLKTKDRLFLLVLAKEVEAFLTKVQSGDMPNIIPSVPLATTSTSALSSMTASFIVGSKAASTFQRMLVYKLADWYGVKAVHTPEVGIIIGVIGICDPNSISLRLADLAPRTDSPPPKIKLMRRNQGGPSTNGSSRPGSAVPSAASSETGSGSNRAQTLEEREEAYAKARQRIYGPEGETPPPSAAPSSSQLHSVQQGGGRQAQVAQVEFETAPRTTAPQQSSGLYAQRNDPAIRKPQGPPMTANGNPNTNGMANGRGQPYNPQYQYQQPLPQPQMQQQQYSQYGIAPQAQMGQYPNQNYGYPPQGPGFNPMPNGNYMPVGGMNPMYANQQPQGYQNQWGQMAPPQVYGPPQMASMNNMPPMHPGQGQGWAAPNQLNMQHQPMPMIPQGMQPSYGYGNPNPHGYPHLIQPTPMRPPPHPHSSASSSISSMSYHSSNWHDISRPHSRGSTTSNMSATSSVRFGAMYPATQQGGRYQQKGMKGSRGGTAGRRNSGSLTDSRSTRPHSPSSAGTTSSHSSRRAGSISLVPPSQHPLPSRPDWAANNIQYHPAPVPQQPYNPNGGAIASPSSNDFPPLGQHGAGTATIAEPMQVERAKMRHPSGSAWSAAASTSPRVSISQPPAPASPIVPTQAAPSAPAPVPAPPVEPTTNISAQTLNLGGSNDPDFPRRAPSMNSSQTLYDPSAPTTSSRPESTKPVNVTVVEDVTAPGMIPVDIIEAKLAEVSLREGVEIGPPPVKTHGPPSYAKIVRRE